MKHRTLIALVVGAGFLAASILPTAADGAGQPVQMARTAPTAVVVADDQPGASVVAQQVTPAHVGNRGVEAADAAVGSLLSLASLALVAVFGSRWLIGRRR